MATLTTHETKAVSSSVVSPATTLASIQSYGVEYVLMTSTQNIRFTVDGTTDPVITGGSEVGTLLGPAGAVQAIILTTEEFLNLKMIRESSDARVQFEFLTGTRRRMQ